MLGDLQTYLGVALAGLVSFLSPCVLPLVPPYLGYLGGTTVDQMTAADGVDERVWRRVVLASLCFVLGFTTVFVGLGAGASLFGALLNAYRGPLAIAAGIVIILFGLHFLGLFRISLFYREARFHLDIPGASYFGAYLIGLAFAFGWTPCIGPILGTVITLAGSKESAAEGMRLLFVYSLGLGIPFILAAVAIKPFLSFMRRFKRHLGLVEKAMGVMLVIAGLLFLSGSINGFGNWLLDTFPGLQNMETWLTPAGLQQDIMQRGGQ